MAHILVVDDDAEVRDMICEILKLAGHEVEYATNGDEALKCYRNNAADLIITDLLMPEKDGLETIMELKRDNPDLKIIAISGGGRVNSDTYLDMAEGLGAECTFTKPFDRKKFLKAISDICL